MAPARRVSHRARRLRTAAGPPGHCSKAPCVRASERALLLGQNGPGGQLSHPGRYFVRRLRRGALDARLTEARPESYLTLLVAGLAQLVERRLPKPKVV